MRFTLSRHVRLKVNLAAVLVIAAAAALPANAAADPPSRVTIVSVFDPITFGENDYVNGQLNGDGQGGQTVALEQSAPPFTDWTPVTQTTTDPAGYYSFKLQPSQTMQYRTNSQGTPSDRVVQISVAPRMTLKASAAGRKSVLFSGTFAPALDGGSVVIQRRSASGRWTSVANARLHGGGKTFQGRMRASKPVTLRAFFASDGAHLDGFSNTVTAAPGAAKAANARAAACPAPRITRAAYSRATLRAGSRAALRVRGSLPGGRIYAVDVRWGDGAARDHFTLAPAYRKPDASFLLTHVFKTPGAYTATVRVYGSTGGCRRSSSAAHPTLTAQSSSSSS